MLQKLTLSGFKSFGKKTELVFSAKVTAIVGPNGSGKSNISDSFRWVLGEQSFKSIRGKRGEDFIYHGSSALPRAGHAEAAIVFDNRNRRLDIDYDEVEIARKVFRDGANEYYVNGTRVRLKDVIELLASVGIGASSHHIISQGEADRFLLAHPDERRVMIEDALGIKIYQYKKAESERKLAKTEANIKEVESVRRELAPHIKYLKKQVDKIEQARVVQDELIELYRAHFAEEENYIARERERLATERAPLAARKKEVDAGIEEAARKTAELGRGEYIALERQIADIQTRFVSEDSRKDEAYRALGRIEGARAALGRNTPSAGDGGASASVRVRIADMQDFEDAVAQLVAGGEKEEDGERLRALLRRIGEVLRHFISRYVADGAAAEEADRTAKLAQLEEEIRTHERAVSEATAAIGELNRTRDELTRRLEEQKDVGRDARLELVAFQGERGELVSRLQYLDRELALIDDRQRALKQEIGEAHVLVGRGVMEYPGGGETFDRQKHEQRFRKIERMKIQLEDLGGDSEQTVKEYEQITERDAHLASELADLASGAETLERLIAELSAKLDNEFARGVKEINAQFGRFFGLLFGGGTARLRLVRPELNEEEQELGIEAKDGVDIEIDIPKKRVRSLQMLSGGERTLASLALLFAVAYVNPPPFMILDETDAALDEINSKKYGEMVEELARGSQLIIITHNRETMSHAGILYGITMGGDGSSKVLSLQFEEAGESVI